MTNDHSHDTHAASDRGAAITGLIVGAIAILIILTTIVKLTNAHYAHEKPVATSTP
jgi:hypothetical protein